MAEYATVDQLYAEGVSTDVTEAQLLARIRRASALIERYTGRWFYPRACTIQVDGTESHILQLGMPIIAVQQVRVLTANRLIASDQHVIPLEDLRVYNRHLSQNLTSPDDRCNPKIQYVFGAVSPRPAAALASFPRGVQNVEVTGLFGFTDFDGGETLWEDDGITPVGKVPDIIRDVCMMLVVRDLLPLADLAGRSESVSGSAIRQLKTRDQSITYGSTTKTSSSFGTGIAGNPELEAMLAPYCRLGQLGAV